MAEQEEKRKEKISRKPDSGVSSGQTPATPVANAISDAGTPLPGKALRFFRNRMGYDFSGVRIHQGSAAARSAEQLGARAYQLGQHLVFRDGEYDAGSRAGIRLLAHELTHVIQQGRGVMRKAAPPPPEGTPEIEPPETAGTGSSTANKENRGGSPNLHLEGHTEANYDHGTFSTRITSQQPAQDCADCGGDPCVEARGTLVSVFHAHPVITLPPVPPGLSPSVTRCVRRFITRVLAPHEQQHRRAFKTYDGTVHTPFTYHGCQSPEALNIFVQPIHDAIETGRAAHANALSDALDPFNVDLNQYCQESNQAQGKEKTQQEKKNQPSKP